MPKTDWNDAPISDAAWLKQQIAKPGKPLGNCLWCGRPKCGCFQDDPFGERSRDKAKDDAQPMLQLFPSEE